MCFQDVSFPLTSKKRHIRKLVQNFRKLFDPELQITSYRADFLAGQFFDIRLEVHQPKNGSEYIGLPLDERFTFTVAKKGAAAKSATEYFKIEEPKLEKWNFTYWQGE
jgi:hypothetical protein